ncbi:MAG: NYN domain-containing protein [Erythrobacter sp.]
MSCKSTILVDFDNIFLGLWRLDPDLALQFANSPDLLLDSLSDRYLTGDRRRWLVARCYLNPAGYVIDGKNADGSDYRRFFSRFRPLWVGAGFEVVDTPTLARDKNAADIRIVIDALDLLQHPTGYDEFVIASGDSDFTPLLLRLRAHDKAITVITAGFAAPGYVSVADRVLTFEAIGALLRPQAITAITDQPSPPDDLEEPDAVAEARANFARFIGSEYSEATRPLNLAHLAQRAALAAPGFREARWGGAGFAAALAALDLPHAKINQHYLWDEERHEEPPVVIEDASGPDLPELVDLLVRVVDLPRLPSESWPLVFDAVASHLLTHEFNLSETTRSVRDKLAAAGTPVGRAVLNFVVRGAQFGGAPFTEQPPPDKTAIAQAFLSNLVDLAYKAGVNIDSEDEKLLSEWLGLDPDAQQQGTALS